MESVQHNFIFITVTGHVLFFIEVKKNGIEHRIKHKKPFPVSLYLGKIMWVLPTYLEIFWHILCEC